MTPRRMAFSISSPCGTSPGLSSPGSSSGCPTGIRAPAPSRSLSSPSPSGAACLCSSAPLSFWLDGGGLTDACPLHEDEGMLVTPCPLSPAAGDSGLCSGHSSVPVRAPGSPPGISGTVGVLTGITGVLIGMGPPPMVPRLTEGLVEGVRLMVATPGVTMTGPSVVGRPAVEAGRLV